MAKDPKAKTVKVTFTGNVSFKHKIHAKGDTLDVSEDEALALIEAKHATETKEQSPEEKK